MKICTSVQRFSTQNDEKTVSTRLSCHYTENGVRKVTDFIGIAKCCPEDEFNYLEGVRISTARAEKQKERFFALSFDEIPLYDGDGVIIQGYNGRGNLDYGIVYNNIIYYQSGNYDRVTSFQNRDARDGVQLVAIIKSDNQIDYPVTFDHMKFAYEYKKTDFHQHHRKIYRRGE